MTDGACIYPEREERAVKFAGGTLARDEHDEFALHLLSCADCRALVGESAELRAGFRVRARRRSARVLLPAGALAAAAAAVAWLVLTPSALQRLGAVQRAPELRVMAVRAEVDSAALYVERGVSAYQSGDYDDAVTALSRAYVLESEPGTAYLLGTARLMNGSPESAVAAFGDVLRAGTSPYSNQARFYRAHALLQLERRDSALADLRMVAANDESELRARAAQLLERVQRLR